MPKPPGLHGHRALLFLNNPHVGNSLTRRAWASGTTS
jgi:hypothetical protein